MTRVLRILALTACAETAALVAWFIAVDRRAARQCELIDQALAGHARPGATIDDLLMQVAAARGAR